MLKGAKKGEWSPDDFGVPWPNAITDQMRLFPLSDARIDALSSEMVLPGPRLCIVSKGAITSA